MITRQLRSSVATLAALLLCGCAAHVPQFDLPRTDRGPTVASITGRIACELEEIALGNQLEQLVSDIYDVDVTLQLTLDVTQDGALAPTTTYLDGGFTLGTGFRLEQSREQNFTEQLFFSLRELKLRAQNSDRARNCAAPVDTNLSGDLGLRQAFDLAMTSNPDLNWVAGGAAGAFGGSITFLVKKDITATGPTWTLRRFRGPGALATLGDDNNDRLVFAFTRGKMADKDGRIRAKAEGLAFINNLISTQLAISLNSISQTLR